MESRPDATSSASPSESEPSSTPPPAPESASATPNEFASESASSAELEVGLDIESFRVEQDYAARLQLAKRSVSVPVGRPNPQAFINIHPSPEWRIPVNVLEIRATRRIHLVARELVPEVMNDLVPKLLVAYSMVDGSWGLWPIRLRGALGEMDPYNESAHRIVMEYANTWVRVMTDKSAGRYVAIPAAAATMGLEHLPVPRWPDKGFAYIFDLAFRGQVIRSMDHPVLRSLRGETF
jgi:hypothetical protein